MNEGEAVIWRRRCKEDRSSTSYRGIGRRAKNEWLFGAAAGRSPEIPPKQSVHSKCIEGVGKKKNHHALFLILSDMVIRSLNAVHDL